ncbi:MAG: hypothetical protein UY41_C0003G0007 [Candidatus Moranbacteria bacterium GW2011_GWE1_49_15]|nr:MAG: hypothetical protein UX75_C0010G0022 [Candidatus Moranbacteria bacterium GW2011_GWE2_47_10]KKW07434.1 MAG: hypothetical protein UY41_C0003G0007 [Candidatus Moranbacteria bacterium GW2011_GWE1_49_15]HBP01478.1 DUF378 domain-containing protein [Candidatus Moranbacteria bacterium]
MKNLNVFDWIGLILVVIGGINWGLIGLLNFDLVSTIFGDMTLATRIIYGSVGVSALYLLFMLGNFSKK